MFEQALAAILAADRIIIHRHVTPDGDALGSQIGLKEILRANFPEKEVYVVGDGAGRFSFMEGSRMDDVPDAYYEGALAVVLDTASRALVSDDRFARAAHTVRIDHHLSGDALAEVEVTDPTFESCCGVVTAFALESRLTIPASAATALYTGMVTDSGRFRYDCTGSRSFRLAAELLDAGADPSAIYPKLYATDYETVRLRALFTLKIRFTEHRVAYIYTTKEELAELGMDVTAASRGMVGTMGNLRGVDIWVNFTESDEGVICEIRSSKYNINPLAVKYGGGGRPKASGATLKDREEAERVLKELDTWKREAQ